MGVFVNGDTENLYMSAIVYSFWKGVLGDNRAYTYKRNIRA